MNRLADMMHLVAHMSGRDETVGEAKLNSLLFASDMTAHRVLGRSISGAQYVKAQSGPVPRSAEHALRVLIKSGAVAQQKSTLGKSPSRRLVPLGAAPTSFSVEEMDILRDTVTKYQGVPAPKVAEASLAWQLTDVSEIIPFEMGAIKPRRLPADRERALAARLVALYPNP